VPSQLVTVGGNVVLTQGKNVLKGDRLVIDLKTNESRFENTGNTATGGRIRALFMPKEDAAAKPGDAKADDASSAGATPEAAAASEASGSESPAADGQDTDASAKDEASKATKPADDMAPFPLVPGFGR
jgi:hypothetical protein